MNSPIMNFSMKYPLAFKGIHNYVSIRRHTQVHTQANIRHVAD